MPWIDTTGVLNMMVWVMLTAVLFSPKFCPKLKNKKRATDVKYIYQKAGMTVLLEDQVAGRSVLLPWHGNTRRNFQECSALSVLMLDYGAVIAILYLFANTSLSLFVFFYKTAAMI